jgi:NTE family protein
MPGIFTPCRHGSRWRVDGGLSDHIPASLCRTLGADIVIAVNLNADIMGKKLDRLNPVDKVGQDTGKNNHNLPAKLISFLYGKLPPGHLSLPKLFTRGKYARGSSIFEVMVTSIHIMHYQITRQRLALDELKILVVPRLAHIALLEFNRAGEAIREGYEAMNRLLPRLHILTG